MVFGSGKKKKVIDTSKVEHSIEVRGIPEFIETFKKAAETRTFAVSGCTCEIDAPNPDNDIYISKGLKILECTKCGASLTDRDINGHFVCAYCGTRYVTTC